MRSNLLLAVLAPTITILGMMSANLAIATPIQINGFASSSVSLFPSLAVPGDLSSYSRQGFVGALPTGVVNEINVTAGGAAGMKGTQRSLDVGNTSVNIHINIPVHINAPVGTKAIELFLGLSDSGYLYSGGGGSGLLIASAFLLDANGNQLLETSLPSPQSGIGTDHYAILFNNSVTKTYQTPGNSFTGRISAVFDFWAYPNNMVDGSSQFALLDTLDYSNPVDMAFVNNFIPLEILQNFDSRDFGIKLTLQAFAIPEPATFFLFLLALSCIAVTRRCVGLQSHRCQTRR
jgi:hypothetical protein